MVMIKNGKPVVPGPNDPKNRDIHAPKANMGQKVPKVMKVPTQDISRDPYVLDATNRGSNMKGSPNG